MRSAHFGIKRAREPGFTLVELVTVMILVGILAAVALPRFFDRTFDERGFHDAVKAAVQHARRVAVASRRYVCATITSGSGAAGMVSITMDATMPEVTAANVACGTAIPLPSPGRNCAATNQVCAPNGVVLDTLPPGGSVVIFDPLGRSVTTSKTVQATALVITIDALPNLNITIQPETGWVQ